MKSMATAQGETEYFELTVGYWGTVIIAGILAGIAMGVIMQVVMEIIQTVGALYTVETTVGGWISHLWHSVVFALMFGGFFIWKPIREHRKNLRSSIPLGITWGVILWLGAAGVIMPLWLSAVGLPAPSIPALNPISGVGHVLYGSVLGGTIALANRYR